MSNLDKNSQNAGWIIRGSISGRDNKFLFSLKLQKLALGPLQSHLHGFRVSLSEAPRPGPEVKRPYPSSVEVNLLKPTGYVMHQQV